MDLNKWTLSNIDEHPVEEVRFSSKKLNEIFSKLKKEHITILLISSLGLVVIGVLFYFLVGRNHSSTLAQSVPANDSSIEVPATAPTGSDDPTTFVQPAPQAVLGVSNTASSSPSATPTATPTPSPTDTPTPTPTDTPTPSPTDTPTPTPSPTVTPSPTPTLTPTPSPTPTPT